MQYEIFANFCKFQTIELIYSGSVCLEKEKEVLPHCWVYPLLFNFYVPSISPQENNDTDTPHNLRRSHLLWFKNKHILINAGAKGDQSPCRSLI